MSAVPKLRFPEFEDEWLETKIGSIAKVTSGGTPSRENIKYWNGSIPWVTTSEIKDCTITKCNQSITPLGLKNSSAKIFPKGTMLIAMYGQGQTRGRSAVLGVEAATNQACAALLMNDSTQPYFVFYNINKRYAELRDLANDGSQKNLSGGLISSLNIFIPQLPEQQKIASFLSSVDKKIDLLRQKKSELELYKKGLMQKIFSQKIRFKTDDGSDFPDWEEVALGDVLDYEQPTQYIVDSTEYSDIYETPVLTAGKSFILGYTDENFSVYEKNLPVIIFDDFTTASKFVDFAFKVKSSAMKILKNKRHGDSLKVIFELINQIGYFAENHQRHWISIFAKFQVQMPSQEEQQKIASFLSAIDLKIQKTSSQIEQMETFKKGLLQQMFV